MRHGRRHGLSAEQKVDIWRRWKAGESMHEIGRAFDKDHGSIQFLLGKHGGIAPVVRRRSERTLTLAEREEISRGIASCSSIREIARGLQRAASTVSREVARHGGRPVYRASQADQQAWKLALRAKTCLLAKRSKLCLIFNLAVMYVTPISVRLTSTWECLELQAANNRLTSRCASTKLREAEWYLRK